jgi:hypothetical protein
MHGCCNHLQDAKAVRYDVEIAESQNPKSFGGKECVSPLVARLTRVIEMLPAIDLDNQLRRMGDEIDNVGTDRGLPPKAGAFQPVCAQAVPDRTFGFRQILSERSGARAHFRLDAPSRRWDARSPLPTLPRKRGRGSMRRGRTLTIVSYA